MKNPFRKTWPAMSVLALVFGLLNCNRSEWTDGHNPVKSTDLSFGALQWSSNPNVNWTLITTAPDDTVLDLAMGADGTVFKVQRAKSAAGKPGVVYKYAPNRNSSVWVDFGDSATALGVDTNGNPWRAKRDKVMKWTGTSSGVHTWSEIAAPDTVRDIAITATGKLFALCRAGVQSEGTLYRWTGDIAATSVSGSWESVGTRAFAIAAGPNDLPFKADSTGRIARLNGSGGWDAVDSVPTREIAIGANGRIWITLRNSPAGGDTIAYKDGGASFVKISGLGAHIASHGWILWGADAASSVYRASTYRSFESSFEAVSDFGNYFTASPVGDVEQEFSADAKQGAASHKGHIIDDTGPDNGSPYWENPHRAYPFIKLHEQPGGAFGRRTLTSMWVKLDIELAERTGVDDWFSFATFSSYQDWNPVVVVNLTPDNKVYLHHVPTFGNSNPTSQCPNQTCTVSFPMNTWVRLDIYLDMNATAGRAKVWQNGVLVNQADLTSQADLLSMAHFGMYASPAVDTGDAYNDKLRIQEVADSTEAQLLVDAPF